MRIVVVGGGIAGLAAAHRLLELEAHSGAPVDITICEASSRLGGAIRTERSDGYLIEAGPDSFLTEKPWALALCERLGLADRLIATELDRRQVFVARGGRLHPLPEGFGLLAPTRLGPVLQSRLFSWRGKVRIAMDLLLPRGPVQDDESLAAFVRRRLGGEVLERVAQPMVAGIYTADPETLSLAATIPRFLELERRYRSVIRGLRRSRPLSAAPAQQRSIFVTLADGMETLVTALASRLPTRAVHPGNRVVSLDCTYGARGHPLAYTVGLADGSTLGTDGIVLAAGAYHAAGLLAGLDPDLSGLLRSIPYASSATVTLAYRRDEIAHPLDGVGVVVPQSERRPILACTFSSMKFPGRAPAGCVLLRVLLGGALQAGVLDQDDTWLAHTATQEVAALLGATGTPHLVRVHRHPQAIPQYLVGHLDRVAAIEARAAHHPALALAGAAYRGIGIPDCIRSGEEAAERVLTACLNARVDRSPLPEDSLRVPSTQEAAFCEAGETEDADIN